MGSPKVNYSEVDLSTRVASFAGIAAGLVIPATKGPVNEKVLVTSDSDLLSKFTPDGRIEVGMDVSYFSALAYLQKSDKLWVSRAANAALYGGASFGSQGGVFVNAGLSIGTGDPSAHSFVADECLLLYGANEGAWNDEVTIRILNYATSPDTVKEPDSFLIRVYKSSNDNVILEEHLCSRIVGKLDGFNRNIFVEDVLEASNYVRAISNVAIAEATQPQEQLTSLALNGGDDGSAVTDSQRITALAAFANKEDVALSIIMDGGNATSAFHSAIDVICQDRKDCVGILSTPYADESSATYMTDIVDFRKTDQNLNSSYSALYTPHVKIYDKDNDRNVFVAPDGYAAAAISFTASNFEMWYPPAGFKRGLVNVLDVRRRFATAEMDVLYDAGINPIRFAPGRGILIWGQKTLLGRPSALDRLNVRLLLIEFGPRIAEALESFMFELNDDATRAQAKGIIDSTMDRVKARRGVSDFLTVIDTSNNTSDDIDNYRMNVDLFITPNKSVEEIPFRVVITRDGVDFSVAQQSV